MEKGEVFKKILLLIIAYLVCWLIAYFFVNQDLNFARAYQYFVMAWSFQDLALPKKVWWISNAMTLVVVILYFIRQRRRWR